ncbi:MAG: glycoside hydrolase family 127 protein, partial [Candidatus Omnitrophica bacterium]|nr:glycoside hydrolase family 127 protein [Candidatus Omnitrophota bacterium]
ATAMVEKGRKLGRPMVEGTWIIDDLGEGDLQFDNGICGLAMIAAYELSGDEGFLESARRAAEWAITRPLVPNWNYNAFSARLLARLYVTTRDSRYLEEARRKFQLGVLPGQTETGRWLDPHNARTPYHAILATALVDYVEALELAVAPDAADVRSALVLALDNLALQTIAYGASNVHELLPLEAFYRGVKLGGARSDWCDAVKVNLNVLTPELCARFARELGHLPETLPYGILALDHDR